MPSPRTQGTLPDARNRIRVRRPGSVYLPQHTYF